MLDVVHFPLISALPVQVIPGTSKAEFCFFQGNIQVFSVRWRISLSPRTFALGPLF